MAGIGDYEKGKAFTLKSGNKPVFKMVGSTPAKHGPYANPNDPSAPHGHENWKGKDKDSPADMSEKRYKKQLEKRHILKSGGAEVEDSKKLQRVQNRINKHLGSDVKHKGKGGTYRKIKRGDEGINLKKVGTDLKNVGKNIKKRVGNVKENIAYRKIRRKYHAVDRAANDPESWDNIIAEIKTGKHDEAAKRYKTKFEKKAKKKVAKGKKRWNYYPEFSGQKYHHEGKDYGYKTPTKDPIEIDQVKSWNN